MPETTIQSKLRDGTLIRHRMAGYEGRIDGTTEMKVLFTAGGKLLEKPNKETFQYRVLIKGELLRKIAPADDLEVLESAVDMSCVGCRGSFRTKPGLLDKAAGRCSCGGWICPTCLDCRNGKDEAARGEPASCPRQRKRLARKLMLQKREG